MKDVTTGLMMFHMDLLRNCENTPTPRICDPVKNETITSWLEENKRKKREADEEAKKQLEDYRRNKAKKQRKSSSTGNLNAFIVRAKKPEPPKEKESEIEQKENEEKRESVDDILLTVPKSQVNMSQGSQNSDALDLKRTLNQANKLAGKLENILNSKKSDAEKLQDEIDERIAEQKMILTLSTSPEDLMHRSAGLIWDMIAEEEGVACHTCYDAFKKHSDIELSEILIYLTT